MAYAYRSGNPSQQLHQTPPREHRQGVCPTCAARDGAPCRPQHGRYPAGGTHVKRLRAAGIDPVTVVGTTAYGRAQAALDRAAWAAAVAEYRSA